MEPRPPAGEHGWPSWADPVAVTKLRTSLRDERIGHAYLLAGPPGVGKRAMARAFAQSLCCTDVSRLDRSSPCGECRACRNVLRGAHPDVEIHDLESQATMADKSAARAALSIDTVRRLRSSASLLPLEASRRLVIVDDAETLLEPAQQALLKTLEEPPPTVTLLLLTDEPETLLETVRSRCHEIAVRTRSEAQVRSALLERGVDELSASEIASVSRGAAAWAIAAASDSRMMQDRLTQRDTAIAWLHAAPYDRLVTAYRHGEQFTKRRQEVIGIVQSSIQVLRERMIEAATVGPAPSDASSYQRAAPTALNLGRAVSASLQCLADLDANVRPKLALEAMVVQWPILESPQV